MADKYPDLIAESAVLETILRDVGVGTITFEIIRDKEEDFLEKYGLPNLKPTGGGTPTNTPGGITDNLGAGTSANLNGGPNVSPGSNNASSATQFTRSLKTKALSLGDPRSVTRKLKKFYPKGINREKLVTLLDEARTLKLEKHPFSFCFLLRSMFEISAKAYCADHDSSGGPKMVKSSGEDRNLKDVLMDVVQHLTQREQNKPMTKLLHGAKVDLAKSDAILSVTSMNQLIHNPQFAVNEKNIASVFHNIYPLLEEMNNLGMHFTLVVFRCSAVLLARLQGQARGQSLD